jgi:glycosyltransferase involved in cell wall biosynthesis
MGLLGVETEVARPQPPEEATQSLQEASTVRSKALTVAVDLTQLLPGGENGGLKIAVLNILEELRRVHPQEFRFVILTSTLNHEELKSMEREGDVRICVTRSQQMMKRDHAKVCSWLKRRLLLRGVDVFYCPFGDIRRALSGRPVVAWITDVLHRDYPYSVSIDEMEARETYFRVLKSGADAIQVNSEFTAKRLQELYRIPREKTFITYLPPQSLERAPQKTAHRNYFLYPANFWVHKNHESLLVGFRHLVKTCTKVDWDLYLTGSPGEQMNSLRSLAKTLEIDGRVRFLGYLTPGEFSQVFASASALVFPSLYEGFGIPLVEAMRLGIPIVTGQFGSIPEVCGEACLYVDSRNPIELAAGLARVATDLKLRHKLAELGRQRAEHFPAREAAEILAKQLLKSLEQKRSWISPLKKWIVAGYGGWLRAFCGARYRYRRLKRSVVMKS